MGLFSSKKSSTVSTPGTPSVLLEAEKDVQKRYERDVWWVENRYKLRAAGILAVIIVEALLALVGVWAFVDYFLLDYVEEQSLVEGFFVGADSLNVGVQSQAPQGLETERVSVVASSGSYDLVTFITNPNPNWVARVSYRLTYRGEQTEQAQVLLMQDTTVPLVAFNIEPPRPSNVNLEIDTIEWYRVDGHMIPDPLQWKQERVNFDTADVQQLNDVDFGGETIGRTVMTLHNKTGYGYFEVPLVVVLRRGGTVVGVNRTVVSSLMPREQRQIQVNWFDRSPNASTVEVYPLLNLYDDATYLDPDAQEETDLRDALIRRR